MASESVTPDAAALKQWCRELRRTINDLADIDTHGWPSGYSAVTRAARARMNVQVAHARALLDRIERAVEP